MSQNTIITVTANKWTRVTDADATNVMFQNRSDVDVYVAATDITQGLDDDYINNRFYVSCFGGKFQVRNTYGSNRDIIMQCWPHNL